MKLLLFLSKQGFSVYHIYRDFSLETENLFIHLIALRAFRNMTNLLFIFLLREGKVWNV